MMRCGVTFLVLLQLAAVAQCTSHYSDCEITRTKRVEYLDRHEVGNKCSKNSPMTGFQLGQNSCSRNDMRYKYDCFDGETEPFAEPATTYSSCEQARGENVEYLDRANVNCGSDSALVNFDLRSEKLEYLDRLDLDCPEDRVLQSFRLEQGSGSLGCSGKDMRYKFTCAKPVIAPDISPPPPSPPPPAPLWVDYENTVCKSPSADPNDNDDGTYARFQDISPNSLSRCQELCLENDEKCYGVEYFGDTGRCDLFTEPFTHYKKKNGRHCSMLAEEGEAVFKDIGEGKCTVQGGKDPDHEYFHGLGEVECEARCKDKDGCFGYSVSSHANCLIWLQGKIDDPHVTNAEWGNAGCSIKVIAGVGTLEDYKSYIAASSEEANTTSSLFIFGLVGCVAVAAILGLFVFRRRTVERENTGYSVVMQGDL
ncbi:hypothetical protein CYMTET_29932 [Cymbomonas tetramitiformis]|uniref:Apple domain-containing protein n=1 Tax=Cymbomonas tetramitiformis TaxID=36881 RepID=A0AAE0FK35_9CHLO|nr:hypothetical protein CYMTET_29932 [Cymbomonas tetramitiformis]